MYDVRRVRASTFARSKPKVVHGRCVPHSVVVTQHIRGFTIVFNIYLQTSSRGRLFVARFKLNVRLLCFVPSSASASKPRNECGAWPGACTCTWWLCGSAEHSAGNRRAWWASTASRQRHYARTQAQAFDCSTAYSHVMRPLQRVGSAVRGACLKSVSHCRRNVELPAIGIVHHCCLANSSSI